MSKEKCKKCGELAVWLYMPKGGYYCDGCVPRGCSCNWYPVDADSDELIEEKDEYGRSYPCCEYFYDSSGYDACEDENCLQCR